MKSEKLYEAVTQLRDNQILAGENPLQPTQADRRAARRRWALVAAALGIVVLAGALTLPRLLRRDQIPQNNPEAPVYTMAPGSPAVQTPESPGGQETGVPAPGDPGAAEVQPLAYNLAAPTYPNQVPYPNEMEYTSWRKYEAALDEWVANRNHNRPDGDYTENLRPFLEKTIPTFLAGAETENRLYSPLNLYLALAMVGETAGGESRQEILNLLGAPDITALRDRAEALFCCNYADDGRLTSLPANSLWLRDDTVYNPEVGQTVARRYYASLFAGPMGSEAYDAAFQAWMNQQTRGLLAEQIRDLHTTELTVAAIASTLYYKAAWTQDFIQDRTRIFHSPAGDRDVDMLAKSQETVFYDAGSFTAVGQSLEGSGSMFFLLPTEGTAPSDLLADPAALAFLTDPAARTATPGRTALVHLHVPSFDVSDQQDLIPGLRALGVTAIFDAARSDFSPLTTDSPLPIVVSQATQGTRLMIDQEGCTGAAYTVMLETYAGIPEEPPEEIDFTLDRPFLFLVTNSEGEPLFVGVVNEP